MRLRTLPTPRALLGLLLLTLPVVAQAQDVTRALDEYLSARTAMGRFSGVVLVARDGKIILRKGYGYADVERRQPYTPETRHEIASLSKMFTAMGALKLRAAGKLRLEDSICKYLADCPAAGSPSPSNNSCATTPASPITRSNSNSARTNTLSS